MISKFSNTVEGSCRDLTTKSTSFKQNCFIHIITYSICYNTELIFLTYCPNLLHCTQMGSDSQTHHHLNGFLMTAVKSEFQTGVPALNYPLTTNISFDIFNHLVMNDLFVQQHAAPAACTYGTHYSVQAK